MARKCDCAGTTCAPQDDVFLSALTRRQFVTALGVTTAGVLLAEPAGAAPSHDAVAENKPAVPTADAPRVYHSDIHRDARMPLGGIGTGNIDLGVDGQFTTWQLFNTLRDGYVPFFFGIRAGQAARLLQTSGPLDGIPHIERIEMTGEYPVAQLRFHDAALPVQVEMTGFSPFAPLDSRTSSLPVAAFVFKVHNPTKEKQTVSLGAFLQNPIGYDASDAPLSNSDEGFSRVAQHLAARHPNFGGNVNQVQRDGGVTTLAMRATPGSLPTLSRPLTVFTNANPSGLNQLRSVDHPRLLSILAVETLPDAALADPGQTVIWLEDAASNTTDLNDTILRAVRDAARRGATVVLAGATQPLLREYAQAKAAQTSLDALPADILFADFENGYEGWTVQGEAFGKAPYAGTYPNQQPVSGYRGRFLANSYAGDDTKLGRLISRPFQIERRYVRCLVGGGNSPDTQIRLVVDGKIIHRASGRNEERLAPVVWDVSALKGQTAHLEIVDDSSGPWGHINVDHIEFSDLPQSRDLYGLLDELLPVDFADVQPLAEATVESQNRVQFSNVKPRAGTNQSTTRAGLTLDIRPLGAGRVVLAHGPLLSVVQAPLIGARQRAFAILAEIAGHDYTAPSGVPAAAPGFGTVALSCLAPDATALVAFDDWKRAWETFATEGRFASADGALPSAPTPAGQSVNGALAASVTVDAGQSQEIVFLLAWHYPNKYGDGADAPFLGCHYTTVWPDAVAAMREAVANFATLRRRTELFRTTLFDSTLPYSVLDAVSSQISTMRHIGVTFRIANGDLYAWEGSNGCCPPTCTHVWGYEQSLARLFPDLEKEMRRIDFFHQQNADGGVNNRTQVPSPPHPSGEFPFADGHASGILKAYREACNHPNDGFLKTYWPRIKRAVDYLVARDAASTPGSGGPDGTLSDDQWNTYDNAIHGVNSFIGTYYLAALRAGEEMARRQGEADTAARYRAVFEKGQENLSRLCWNGEYFQQHLPGYETRVGEYGPGCLSDQVLGQWWAHQLGLGYLLPKEQIQAALRAVVKYNFLPDHTNWKHDWRKFAGGKDAGLLICTWPKGGRPAHTIPYVDEVWTGIEYQVAAHLIYEGMTDEALKIVRATRARYDGVPRAPIPRNPWNEIECGGHYARAMSSWSLLLAASGWQYDGASGTVRVSPGVTPDNFRAFFSGPEGWGSLAQTRSGKTQRNTFTVRAGHLAVAQVNVGTTNARHVRVTVGGTSLGATLTARNGTATVTLGAPARVAEGQTLTITLT